MQQIFTLTNSVILLMITLALFKGTSSLPNEYCGAPRPTLVALGDPEYSFFPYFVKLHRCGGSCGHSKPTVQKCVVTEYTEISIRQFSPMSGTRFIKVKNHTKCGCSCVAKPDQCHPTNQVWNQNRCNCQCLYSNSQPPTPCPSGFRWNKGSCKCLCDRVPVPCAPEQMWNQNACGCVKKAIVAQNTKPLTGTSDSNTKLFIALLVGESFVLIVLCAVLLHLKCKKHRANKAGSGIDYAKSPITGSTETLNFSENTSGKVNSFVATEVSMVRHKEEITGGDSARMA